MKSFRQHWPPIHRPLPGLPWRIVAVVIGLGLMALWGTGAVRASSLRPALLEPADEAVITGVDAPPLGVPTLRWSPVPGATRYQVQISQSQGFADPMEDTTYATMLTPTKAWVDGVYYWRVRAEVDRNWQEFSEVRTFRKDWGAGGTNRPILISPADGQVLTGFSADHFRWEPVLGAARYRFEISGSPSFNTVDYTAYTLAPQHTPTQRMQNRQYYWRVTPLDRDDHPGAPSDVWGFHIQWSVAPQPLAPENDAVLRFVPRLSWTAVEGAHSYVLEISSESDFASYSSYTTLNTDFTPTKSFANNEDYYWRVKAIVYSGRDAIASPPSEPQRFVTAWKQPPQLLTPANDASIGHSYPFFSWTPVPGAERYRIEIDNDYGFGSPLVDETLYNATSYTQPSWKDIPFGSVPYWRVRAIDAQGNATDPASPSMFRFSMTPPPNLVYPLPYYVPDADMPIHTDRAAPWPVFVWDTTHSYDPYQNGPAAFVMPDYYRLEVSDQYNFATILFSTETAGQAAAPTLENSFYPEDGKLYYWRVQAMKGGAPLGEVIQREVVFDRSKSELPIAPTAIPAPMHPADGFEAVAVAPVLGWLPVTNAAQYEVQVSRGPDFRADAIEEVAHALYPYYVPGQGKTDPLKFGTYWWRVRAKDQGGNVLGDWSAPRHFNLSLDLMTGNSYDYAASNASSLLGSGDRYDPALSFVASSPADPASPYYLDNLHVIQDRSYGTNYWWAVAFGVNSGISEPVIYGILFDVDHVPGSGAPNAPRGNATPHARYRPEYAVYVDRTDDNVTPTLYTWDGAAWREGGLLGGSARYDAATSAVQVLLPYTVLVNQDHTFAGSLAVTVLSLNAGGSVQDTIPAQQGGTFDNPAFVSDMPMPLYPFDTPLDNPFVFREMPTLRWRMPTFDSIDGYQVEIARDINFTDDPYSWETYESGTSSLYAVAPAAFHPDKAYRDEESYYWRVRVRHERFGDSKTFDYGPWSPPMRFKLTSYQVGQPRIAFGNPVATTPTFLWDRVEGAAGYTLQVSTSSDMKSLLINENVDGNSYTPTKTLADGTYYWRVAMRRAKNVYGQWTPVYSFTKRSLVPQPLGPIDGAVVNQQPTFSWAPVIANSPDVNGLRLAAPRYLLQWANNPDFTGATSIETTATAYTLVERRSLSDGPWYWRVAMLDGDGKPGDFSAPQSFYKEYLKPELISPVQGTTPNPLQFEWLPIPGAAYYRFELANNPAFSRSKTTVTANTRVTPLDNLNAAEYYWRVQMVDQDGKVGPLIDGRFATTPVPELGPSVYLPLVHRD